MIPNNKHFLVVMPIEKCEPFVCYIFAKDANTALKVAKTIDSFFTPLRSTGWLFNTEMHIEDWDLCFSNCYTFNNSRRELAFMRAVMISLQDSVQIADVYNWECIDPEFETSSFDEPYWALGGEIK
jgi:hypothetical protein